MIASAVLRGAALVLLLLAVVPLLWWGNPYPPSAVRYWTIGSVVVFMLMLGGVYVPPLRRLAASGGVIGRAALYPAASLTSTAFTWCIAVFAGGTAAWCAWAAFQFGASTTDEIAQLWHARILLTGRWALPVDPDRAFFALDTVVDGSAWYSQFPVGGPALLAAGMLLHAPWLGNALITGAAAAAVYRFARHVYGEPDGRRIAIVFALAPSIVIMGGTMMNHVPTLGCWTLVLWQLSRWETVTSSGHRFLTAGIIGVALGLMVTFRPLDAVVASFVTGVFQLTVFRTVPKRAIEWAPQILGGTIGIAPLLIANFATTGHPLQFAYGV